MTIRGDWGRGGSHAFLEKFGIFDAQLDCTYMLLSPFDVIVTFTVRVARHTIYVCGTWFVICHQHASGFSNLQKDYFPQTYGSQAPLKLSFVAFLGQLLLSDRVLARFVAANTHQ